MALTLQAKNIQSFLTWIGNCPFKYHITSMQGGFIHVKFFIDDKDLSTELKEEA